MTVFRSLLLATFLFGLNVGSATAASFDCDKATTKTEIAICDDPKLSALDELFFGLLESPYVLAKETSPIKRQRSDYIQACSGQKECIINSYVKQIEALAIDPEICTAGCRETKVLLFVDPLTKKKHWFLDVVSSGGAYNLNEKLLYFDGNSISLAKFLVPALNDEIIFETCNKAAFELSLSKFEISQENWGFLEAREPESESSSQIMEGKSWSKWVGHGDLSHSTNYTFENGWFLPRELRMDNCEDQKVQQIPISIPEIKNEDGRFGCIDQEVSDFLNVSEGADLLFISDLNNDDRSEVLSFNKVGNEIVLEIFFGNSRSANCIPDIRLIYFEIDDEGIASRNRPSGFGYVPKFSTNSRGSLVFSSSYYCVDCAHAGIPKEIFSLTFRIEKEKLRLIGVDSNVIGILVEGYVLSVNLLTGKIVHSVTDRAVDTRGKFKTEIEYKEFPKVYFKSGDTLSIHQYFDYVD